MIGTAGLRVCKNRSPSFYKALWLQYRAELGYLWRSTQRYLSRELRSCQHYMVAVLIFFCTEITPLLRRLKDISDGYGTSDDKKSAIKKVDRSNISREYPNTMSLCCTLLWVLQPKIRHRSILLFTSTISR